MRMLLRSDYVDMRLGRPMCVPYFFFLSRRRHTRCLSYWSSDVCSSDLQCMAERRKGGETGVRAVQGLRGDAVWQAMAAESWAAGGWDPRLFEACLSRSHTLAQPPDRKGVV